MSDKRFLITCYPASGIAKAREVRAPSLAQAKRLVTKEEYRTSKRVTVGPIEDGFISTWREHVASRGY